MAKVCSIALCRVSTLEQKVEGHSLDRQETNVKVAADQLGAPIVKFWSLDQSSRVGKNIHRKDLKEMISFCKQNKSVKYLIIDEVDRFMRDITYFYYFEACFEQLGVKIHYASQPELNSGDMMAKFNKLFLIFRAEASNDERMKKSTAGLKARVMQGYYPFPIPQGYAKTETPGLYKQDPDRFTLLQTAIREVLAGYKPAEALRRLNARGYETKSGRAMEINKFMEILRSPFYAGIIHIKTWDMTVEHGLHPNMITPDEFEELQYAIDGKKLKYQRKKHNSLFPLSNLMFCKECGKKLVGFIHRNGKGGEWEKYRCRGCGKQYHKDEVHKALDEVLDTIELSEEGKSEFLKSLEEVWNEEQKESIGYIAMLESRLDEISKKKKACSLACREP